ncbi:MAG: precorrin-6y C5,15-methyltransferase (decarboxylating) subunit CbiE [Clostridia bacterium]|nr:precorrin-6y C5,15-methyltransferase (decarboxylating) subunit CbiE [Clostridia bacterium]
MSTKINVVGIGPGDREYILPAVQKTVENSDVIIGGKRNLELFSHLNKEKVTVGNNLEEICKYIEANGSTKTVTVLASGDPGIYSIAEYLKNRLQGIELEMLPGISSFQYLCSKMKTSWQDIRIVSLHGRNEENLAGIIRKNKKAAVFTGGDQLPHMICRDLIREGLGHVQVTVGENLSYPEERIVTGMPAEICDMSFESLCIMLVQNDRTTESCKHCWPFSTAGIPDDMFIRDTIPMTKEEIRAVTLSKLRLRENDTVFDIGAGTGSVSVECGIRCPGGRVYAVEKNPGAIDLIRRNIDKFSLNNVWVIEGEAPGTLADLPEPDRVFIGGSSGKMGDLLEWITGFGKPVRVVVNAIAIESVHEVIKAMEEKGFSETDIVNVSVARSRIAGGKHLMQAINPVYIISGEYGGAKGENV